MQSFKNIKNYVVMKASNKPQLLTFEVKFKLQYKM